MKFATYIFFIVINALMLTACSGILQDTSDLLANVSKPKSSPSTVNMMVYAEDDINLNESNEATPVSFLLIQLRHDDQLYALDYEELSGDIKKALGKSYVDHDEYIVEPGKFVPIDIFEVNSKTRYIALVCAYRALDKAIWRTSVKIKYRDELITIHAALKNSAVTMEVKN